MFERIESKRNERTQPVASRSPDLLSPTIDRSLEPRVPLPTPNRDAVNADLVTRLGVGHPGGDKVNSPQLLRAQPSRCVACCCRARHDNRSVLGHGDGLGLVMALRLQRSLALTLPPELVLIVPRFGITLTVRADRSVASHLFLAVRALAMKHGGRGWDVGRFSACVEQ